MKYFVQIAVFIVFASTVVCAQEPSPTPEPTFSQAEIESSAAMDAELKKRNDETATNFDRILFQSESNGESMMLGAGAYLLEKSAVPKFSITLQTIERTLLEIKEKEIAPPKLLIDGKVMTFPAGSFSQGKSNYELQALPCYRFETFAIVIEKDDLLSLSQAQSISVIWEKANFVVPPEGIEKLHGLIANEYEWLSKRK